MIQSGLTRVAKQVDSGLPVAKRSSFPWNLHEGGGLMQVETELDRDAVERIRGSATLTLEHMLSSREIWQLTIDLRRGMLPSDRA